jgi:plastocyanin
MRFYGLALATVFALAACGGGDGAATDTAAAGTDTAAGAASTGGAAGTAAMAPITGTTHVVKMVGDDKGYRFEPAEITIKQGDGIRWEFVSMGPHNVAFDPAKVPANAKAQLSANMPNQMGELSSPMMNAPGENYTISFANVPAGTYDYTCTPHQMMGMNGKVTIQ